ASSPAAFDRIEACSWKISLSGNSWRWLKRKHPRPRMGAVDKIFWVFVRRFWGAWKQSLVLVNPETVVCWHHAGFRLYWSWIAKARKQVGRKKRIHAGSGADLPDDGGKPNLGRSPDSRRVPHAGLRCIRAKHLPLDEASAPASMTWPALAGLSSQSSRSDHRHGFFHCPASLLLAITGDRLFISTSLSIPPPVGSSNMARK